MRPFYHCTTAEAAAAILAGGFRDGRGSYLAVTDSEYSGVWISDRPLNVNDGAKGNLLLIVEIEADRVIPYEWVNEPFMGHREFLVPAAVLNAHAKVRRARPKSSTETDGEVPRRAR